MENFNVEKALIIWISNFPGAPSGLASIAQLSDGNFLTSILHHIDPKRFPSPVPTSPPSQQSPTKEGSNWVLVHGKLKKLFKSIAQYYSTVFGQSIDLLEPNLSAIARDADVESLIQLLRLVLVLAVQSERRQVYIQMIQEMEQDDQHALMFSIETIMQAVQSGGALPPASGSSTATQLAPSAGPVHSNQPSASIQPDTSAELQRALKERKDLESSLQASTKKFDNLKVQYDKMSRDHEYLQSQCKDLEAKIASLEKASQSDVIIKSELNSLKSQLEQSEIRKLELENMVESQNSIITDLNRKIEDFSSKIAEASKMKDKLDEMAHVADKLQKAEQTIERFKKRMEDGGDMKKQVKDLESDHEKLIAKNLRLEEEYQKMAAFKPLMENYKTKLMELEQSNKQLMSEKVKLDVELKEMQTQISTLTEEKALEQRHVEALEERIKELELHSHGGDSLGNHFGETLGGELAEPGDPNQLQISELKMEITKLTRENLQLKQGSNEGETQQKIVLLENLLEDANNLKTKYEQDYIEAHKQLVLLENEIKTFKEGKSAADSEATLKLRNSINEYELEVTKLKKTIAELSAKLQVSEDSLVEAKSQLSLLGQNQRQDLENYQAQHDSEIQKVRDELNQLTQAHKLVEVEKQKLLEQVNTILTEKDKLQKENATVKESLTTAENSISQLKEEYSKSSSKDPELQKLLQQKEEQIVQYQKALKKAKDHIIAQDQIIKERKSATANSDNPYNEAVTSLQTALAQKEEEIERLKSIFESKLETYRQEQRLVASAWYDMGMQLQKRQMQQATQGGGSWLSQQRKNILK